MLLVLAGFLLALLLAFCGGFLWFLIRFKRGRDFAAHIQEAVTVEELDLESRLMNLSNQLETITAICLELKERIQLLEERTAVILGRQTRVKGEVSACEMVYKAFERGKKVTELAREFGRTKGEIELMLNLRQVKKEG